VLKEPTTSTIASSVRAAIGAFYVIAVRSGEGRLTGNNGCFAQQAGTTLHAANASFLATPSRADVLCKIDRGIAAPK
jgi:hypothetical protein